MDKKRLQKLAGVKLNEVKLGLQGPRRQGEFPVSREGDLRQLINTVIDATLKSTVEGELSEEDRIALVQATIDTWYRTHEHQTQDELSRDYRD